MADTNPSRDSSVTEKKTVHGRKKLNRQSWENYQHGELKHSRRNQKKLAHKTAELQNGQTTNEPQKHKIVNEVNDEEVSAKRKMTEQTQRSHETSEKVLSRNPPPVSSSCGQLMMCASAEKKRCGRKRRLEFDLKERSNGAKQARIDLPVLHVEDYVKRCSRRVINDLSDSFSRLRVHH